MGEEEGEEEGEKEGEEKAFRWLRRSSRSKLAISSRSKSSAQDTRHRIGSLTFASRQQKWAEKNSCDSAKGPRRRHGHSKYLGGV